MARAIKPCEVAGCNGVTGVKGTARGLCDKHYTRFMKFGDVSVSLVDRENKAEICSVDGCAKPRVSKGYCVAHWSKFNKYGDPQHVHPKHRKRLNWMEAIIAQGPTVCTPWPFGVSKTGRGVAALNGVVTSAPRIMKH